MTIHDLKDLQNAIEDKIRDHFKDDAFDVHYYDRSPHAEIPVNGEMVNVPFIGYCNGKKRNEGERLEYCTDETDTAEGSRIMALNKTFEDYRLSTKTIKIPGVNNRVMVIWRSQPEYKREIIGFYDYRYAVTMRMAVVRLAA